MNKIIFYFWVKNKLLNRWQIRNQPIALLLTGLLIAGIIDGLINILHFAISHWQQPSLAGDSYTFIMRQGGAAHWLFAQHNEHRIVWSKGLSLFESELLKIPPGQSALFQSLALILACLGLWSWICQRLLKRADLQLITALTGCLLLVNPWQYENLIWEFQTPWFMINALVLLCALLLSVPTSGPSSQVLRIQILLALLLPWIALSTTGQGLALGIAFSACAWLHSRRFGALVSFSTALSGLTYFILLPYHKPLIHPVINFNSDYFIRIWLAGQWPGLAVLCVVITAVILGRQKPIPRDSWQTLLMPGLFSLLFFGMVTLSRSGLGLETASASRYVTHTLMLGLTAVMALALLDDQSLRKPTPLLGAFLVLLTTLGSFPQSLQIGGLSYSGAWVEAKNVAGQHLNEFACKMRKASLAANNIRFLKTCSARYPPQDIVDSYFKKELPVQPLGWHQELLKQSMSNGSRGIMSYMLDKQYQNPTTVQLEGWGFVPSNPGQQLYLSANYGKEEQLAFLVDQPRMDVKLFHNLPNEYVGFNALIPKSYKGKNLHEILLKGSSQSVQIWQESLIK